MPEKSYIQVILPLKLEWIPFYSTTQEVSVGDKVKVIFHGKAYVGPVWKIWKTLPARLEGKRIMGIVSVEVSLAKVSLKEMELWKQIASYYLCTIGEVYKVAYPARKILQENVQAGKIAAAKARIEKNEGLAAKARKDETRARYIEAVSKARAELRAMTEGLARTEAGECPVRLSTAQAAAFESIRETFAQGKPALLHGVTGAGKTEIYSRLAWEVMDKGKSVLYLVPEITLSRQLEDRLHTIFGNTLLVFHSHESASSRGETASKVSMSSSQRPYILLGTRSAIFLPHHDLGLIIVDEEHDASYKQDSPSPRYNGRDVAAMMARIQGCPLILGTATPSLESEYNCLNGKYIKTKLEESFYGAEPSEIEIIDTVAERRKRGMRGDFSIKLIEHIGRTIAEGGQVLILCNRRSYSPAVQCIDCGTIVRCPSCNVPMALHKNPAAGGPGTLVCHHCGYTTAMTEGCTQCGGTLRGMGSGTQKIQQQAADLFPDARIERIDSDVTRNAAEEERIIRSFSEGSTDILIGTQIISKGFDFANLALVVVIRADALLAVQDFRADEKAFQMLRQLRGRCGRRGRKGMFVIQTSCADHPVFQQLSSGEDKAAAFLNERYDFGYPPYSRMMVVSIRDDAPSRGTLMAGRLAESLRAALEGMNGAKVTGPYSPAGEHFQDRCVQDIRLSLMKNASTATAKEKAAETVRNFVRESKYDEHIYIDVDPYNI